MKASNTLKKLTQVNIWASNTLETLVQVYICIRTSRSKDIYPEDSYCIVCRNVVKPPIFISEIDIILVNTFLAVIMIYDSNIDPFSLHMTVCSTRRHVLSPHRTLN
jgi:hypothetical protein